MSVAAHGIVKEWKAFNISLPSLGVAVQVIAASYCGATAGSNLTLHFDGTPSAQEISDINDLWDAIDENHAIATEYITADAIAADVLAKKNAAIAKLIVLGLTEPEILGLIG